MLSLKYYPFDLKLSEPFAVSGSSRTVTEAIFVEIKFENETGYGQASFPPYMKEKREDNLKFLSRVDFKKIEPPFSIHDVHQYLNQLSPANIPAKAAIDIAFHDLMAKLKNIPVYELLGLQHEKKIFTPFTIGIGDNDFIIRQLQKSSSFKTLKIKLGGDLDYNQRTISLVRKYSNKPIAVDFNGGLASKEDAMVMIEWLADKNVYMVEQPLPVTMESEYEGLKNEGPIDIFGDESVQNILDIRNKHHLFHGVNVKLMKCGGIRNAFEMARIAKELGLKTMIGCMTESVCAVTAAAHLAEIFDYTDLDGNFSITNDPFKGAQINSGAVIIPTGNGLGLMKR